MKTAVIYVHGKGGNATEAEDYKPLFPGADVIGFSYRSQTPWEARQEFPPFFEACREGHGSLILIANSIGAFFSMNALSEPTVDQALFVSPIVNMEKLITDMMGWAGITEKELRERGEIRTEFGETLSWNYLCYVREHPIDWKIPTRILHGEKDGLTSFETISLFADAIGAPLTVMPGGEHWFHTEEQMRFLDAWVTASWPEGL